MTVSIDIDRTRLVAEKIFQTFHDKGIWGQKVMPEDLIPKNVEVGSIEHLLFITLTVSIDYMREANSLWRISKKTIEDDKTKYLFEPKLLYQAKSTDISEDMMKYSLAKRPKKDPWIWRTVGVSFYKKWGGDPRNFLESCDWDAEVVLKSLKKDQHDYSYRKRHDFPYLRGNKIGSLWVRMLRDNVGIECLKNLELVPIPVDIHIARASLATGVVRGKFEGNLNMLFQQIREAWSEGVRGLSAFNRSMISLDVDEPLWNLSKYGCTYRNDEKGLCPKRDDCVCGDCCVKGDIYLKKNIVKMDT